MPVFPKRKKNIPEWNTEYPDCVRRPADAPSAESPLEEEDRPAHLLSANSPLDCGMVEETLKEAGVPFLKKDRESGGYMHVYMGYSVFGADYFVPSRLLNRANAALEAALPNLTAPAADTSPETDAAPEPDDPETGRAGRLWKRFTLISVILIVCVLLFAYFYNVYQMSRAAVAAARPPIVTSERESR